MIRNITWVFENLLEVKTEIKALTTPREIVHYMSGKFEQMGMGGHKVGGGDIETRWVGGRAT